MSRSRIPSVPPARPSLLARAGQAVMSAIGLGGGAPSTPHHGASTGRRLGGWRPTGSGPNAVVQSSQAELVRRSRDMVRNNPHGKRAVSLVSTHTVGIGIKPRSLCSSAEVREALMELFAEWARKSDADGVLGFYGQQFLAVSEMAEGGECFARLRDRRLSDGLPVPFQVQLVPTEQVPLDYNQPNGGNSVTQGIERTPFGQRVAYWMYQSHPGELVNTGVVDAFPRRVPAASVAHLYNVSRIGQLRGLPWLAAAMSTLFQIDDYFDSEQERKRAAARVVGFIKKAAKGEDAAAIAEAWGEVKEELGDMPAVAAAEPGTMVYLDLDEDISFSQPADVGGNFEAFVTACYQKVAMAVDLLPEELTGDFGGDNDRTFRAKFATFKRRIRQIQFEIVCQQFNQPIWERFVADAVAFGALEAKMRELSARAGRTFGGMPRLPLSDMANVEWRPERWEHLHPTQDVQATVMEIDNGLISRAAAVAERGDDVEVIDAQRKSDKDRENRLGVPVVRAGQPGPAPEPEDDDTQPAKGKD